MPELIPKQQRQVAIICSIKDILDGEYRREEGWTPNYIDTKNGNKISRANIIGVIVEALNKEAGKETFSQIIIDDGSGRISVREFEATDKLSSSSIGDMILIIGRPREFGNEKYILVEIVKKIIDPRWIQVRKLELKKIENNIPNKDRLISSETFRTETTKEIYLETAEKAEQTLPKESLSSRIAKYIRQNDKGDGVFIEEIIAYFKVEFKDGESQNKLDIKIEEMLKQGILFEVLPGKVKFLE